MQTEHKTPENIRRSVAKYQKNLKQTNIEQYYKRLERHRIWYRNNKIKLNEQLKRLSLYDNMHCEVH